ncbi:MAG: hypothetical protein V4527_06810 [Pseudomonadota bacterium]
MANINGLDTIEWLRRENYKVVTAAALAEAPNQVRNTVGVYILFVKNLDSIFAQADDQHKCELRRCSIDGYQHAYTGRSAAMRSRAMHHLEGSVMDSGLREGILALQFHKGVLWHPERLNLAVWEKRLSTWLMANTVVAFRVCDKLGEVGKVEQQVISRLPSPFNFEHNRASAFVSLLAGPRAAFRQAIEETDQLPKRGSRRPSEWLLGRADHLAGDPSKHTT